MAVRLSKVAREFNVGLSTIVEFLHNKGSKISSDPNAKLTDEEYDMLAKAFSTDSKVKKESSSINLKDSRKKKEAVVIDDSGKISTGAEEAAPKDDFISVKDEVKLANHIKIVDRIDLNPERKQPEPEKQEEVAKAPVARKEHKPEKKVKTPAKQQAKVELAEERKPEEEVPQPEKVEAPQPVAEEKPVSEPAEVPAVKEEQEEKREEPQNVQEEEQQEEVAEVPFKVAQPALKDVKVVGSIDLDAINQRTRPPKKSRQERERDRKEQRKSNKPVANKFVNKQDDVAAFSGADLDDELDTKKKRKRIHRQDEKVQIENIASGPGGKPSKMEESR